MTFYVISVWFTKAWFSNEWDTSHNEIIRENVREIMRENVTSMTKILS